MRKIRVVILTFIVAYSIILRFFRLDQFPPSLNWDEIAAGYNAYTIANWGADEYGTRFPIVFKNFGDDKHPVHIYLTALVVKIFGLSDYSTRASSAAIGVLSVIAIYFLAKKLFSNETAGLLAALFLAVSPYHLQYSRGLWEANFALFFFLTGLTLFYYGIEKKNWLIPASFASFGLSFFSYHSAKIVIPSVVLFLSLTNIKKLFDNKKILISTALVVLLFGGLIIKEPKILGFARVNQTKFSEEQISKYGGRLGIVFNNYKRYFTYSYLFQKGDQNPRGSVKVIGEFYKIDLILGLIGTLVLLFKKKWRVFALLFLCLALSPIPGAVSTFEPSSTRGIFMIGPVILLSAYGAAFLVSIFKKKWIKILIALGLILCLAYEFYNYLHYYYTEYSKAEAIEWQYGMKQVVDYVKRNPEYVQVYTDKIRQQPYIFFLYYLKTPLPELLRTVKYDESESKSYNTVLSFGKYQFGGWNIVESYPNYKVLYIITPSYYGGLRYLQQFDVNDLIKYPNGTNAFYIVSGDQ
jgi:4-amino-4-deoxy-L-arabinose transferase-like glycosyltransferase